MHFTGRDGSRVLFTRHHTGTVVPYVYRNGRRIGAEEFPHWFVGTLSTDPYTADGLVTRAEVFTAVWHLVIEARSFAKRHGLALSEDFINRTVHRADRLYRRYLNLITRSVAFARCTRQFPPPHAYVRAVTGTVTVTLGNAKATVPRVFLVWEYHDVYTIGTTKPVHRMYRGRAAYLRTLRDVQEMSLSVTRLLRSFEAQRQKLQRSTARVYGKLHSFLLDLGRAAAAARKFLEATLAVTQ